MAPKSSEATQRRKSGPPSKFKPPRPVSTGKPTQRPSKASVTGRQTSTAAYAQARSHERVPSSSTSPPRAVNNKFQPQSISDDDDDDDSINSDPSRSQDNGEAQDSASPEYSRSQSALLIPPALLTKMFHHHFSSEKVRMSEEARSVAGKYVEVFVREAIARAAFERQEGVKLKEREGRRTVVGEGDFLEVEDLEKLAPQLLLDF